MRLPIQRMRWYTQLSDSQVRRVYSGMGLIPRSSASVGIAAGERFLLLAADIFTRASSSLIFLYSALHPVFRDPLWPPYLLHNPALKVRCPLLSQNQTLNSMKVKSTVKTMETSLAQLDARGTTPFPGR